MPPGRRRYVEAFVLHNSPKAGAYYAWCRDSEQDLIIDYRFCSPNEDLLGKWVEIGTEDMLHCREIRVLNDFYESRVRNMSNVEYSEVKVVIHHDGHFDDQLEMYSHNYLGYVCDPRRVIGNVERNGEYMVWIEKNSDRGLKARWKVSELVAGPLNPCGPRNTSSNGLRMFTGLIHNLNGNKDKYLAFSPSLPKSTITVDFCYCPTDMLGKWVEMMIDESNRVQKEVYILRDKFETCVKGLSSACLVEFQHVPRRQGDLYAMFHHEYFGLICDPWDAMNRRAENSAWYRGWIVHHREEGLDARWCLAMEQRIEGPLNRNDSRPPSRTLSVRSDDRRPPTPERFDYRHSGRFSPGPDNGRRSPVPDRRPPTPQDRFSHDRRADSRSSDHSHRRPPVNPSRHEPPPRTRKESDASSVVSRAPTTDSEGGDEWRQVGSSGDEDEINNRKPVESSLPSRGPSVQGSSYAGSSAPVTKASPTAATTPWNPHANITRPSPSAAPVAAPTTSAPSATIASKPQRTELEKKLRRLQMIGGRLGDFIEDFVAQEQIRTPMQLHNVENYEDMMDLIAKIRRMITDQ